MKPARKAIPAEPPEALRARIEDFVRSCREPALLEPGEKAIPLEAGRFDLEVHGSAVVLHAWGPESSLARRIVRIIRQEPERSRLELAVTRLGSTEASVEIIDRARAGPSFATRVGRLEFRERFRRMLQRQFGGWSIARISAAADLQHSLSPAYTRALVTRGRQAFVAIGADEAASASTCDHILTFGLIWLDHARAREPRRVVEGLKLFLPHGRGAVTARRLGFLDSSRARFELHEFAPDGSVTAVEENNYGNLATTLDPVMPAPEPRPPVDQWIERLMTRFGAERVTRADGLISLRLRGLEFARASSGVMTYGLDQDLPVGGSSFKRVEALAEGIAAARSIDALDKQQWLYRKDPERWLESVVRPRVRRLDGALIPDPLYSQVPAVAGVDRGIIDLLASDAAGRLAVLELKASEDPHLPLQGLDYWMRVKWHLDRGEFSRRGYFPGVELRAAPPRLLLVSPALDFHPTTETILRYFSPQVEVERIGLGAEWRRELKVAFRAYGAEKPG